MSLTFNPLDKYAADVKAANEVGAKIVAAKSDKGDAVKSLLQTSDDPKIVKFREVKATIEEQIETLKAKIYNGEAAIKEHAESLVTPVEEGFDLEAAMKEFLEKRRAATATKNAILAFGITEEQLSEALKEKGVPTEIIRVGGKGGGSKGGGTGVRRPRISAATLNGESVWKKGAEGEKVDFTSLAAAAKSDADTLKKAAFTAAETEDLNSLEAGTVVSFTVGDDNFTVTISGEKPGRKPAEPAAS